MGTKIVFKMISSAVATATARSRARELVARAERKTGSRMLAYQRVAQSIGVSAEWLRRLVNDYSAKEPRAAAFENIRLAYEDFCNRVEQENRADEQRLMRLRGDDFATGTGTLPEGDS